MKKRTLKQQVKQAEKTILKNNEEWYNAFIEQHYGKKPKKKKK